MQRRFAVLLPMIAVSSVVGGVWHGFLNTHDSIASRTVWSAMILSLGTIGLVPWILVAEFDLYRPWQSVIRIFCAVVFAL